MLTIILRGLPCRLLHGYTSSFLESTLLGSHPNSQTKCLLEKGSGPNTASNRLHWWDGYTLIWSAACSDVRCLAELWQGRRRQCVL